MSARRRIDELRSQRWYADQGMRGFAHRQRTQQMGFRREEFLGKPVVAIINTWSELSPCHAHLRDRAEAVKRGVWAAGGFPVELPALSLGEVMVKPTTMFYRNLLAIEAEELLRSHPVDGAVLLGGCDKTTPALLMGALSMDLPVIFCPAGPMASGRWRGERVGAGTHTQRFWTERRAGQLDEAAWIALEQPMTRSAGTCNTMGTASTMTSIAEALGFTLPGASAIPAVDSGHARMASACGARAVELILEDLRPRRIATRAAFEDAVLACMALGGSTNAAIHLMALARRARVALSLDDLDRIAASVPVLADLFPAGRHLMEDFFFAGGLPALLGRFRDRLHLDRPTVSGRGFGEDIAGARVLDDEVIRPLDRPVTAAPALAVLRGNLAPDGCVLKPSAASPALLCHRGPALVFEGMEDLGRRIDDPALPVTAESVLVLRNAGPHGGPGMPEWGALPIPRKLLERGVRDMVRISDARMSGTHGGTCVLHVAPEAFIGGPLALVRDGDPIALDVPARSLMLEVADDELARRRAAWQAPAPRYARGWGAIFSAHVTQAPDGCDLDVLAVDAEIPEPPIH